MNYTVSQDSLNSLSRYWKDPENNLIWPSVFVLPAWMDVWAQVFSPSGNTEFLIRTVRQGNSIIGIAPLMLRDDAAMFIGDTSVCDYQDFITAPGREADFCSAILDDMRQKGIKEMELKHVRPDSVVIKTLAPLAESLGYQVVAFPENVSYEMDLPGSFDEYLEGLTSKQRHEVRRKHRRMLESGEIEYRTVTDSTAEPEVMDDFFRMFVESRQDKADFLTDQMRSFFRLLADAMSSIGLLKLGVLVLDDRPVAQIISFDYNNCIYLYNSGYDPDYTSLSVGLLSKILAIKDSIERGKSRFDFLKGAEVYKGHLGGHEIPLYNCRISIK